MYKSHLKRPSQNAIDCIFYYTRVYQYVRCVNAFRNHFGEDNPIENGSTMKLQRFQLHRPVSQRIHGRHKQYRLEQVDTFEWHATRHRFVDGGLCALRSSCRSTCFYWMEGIRKFIANELLPCKSCSGDGHLKICWRQQSYRAINKRRCVFVCTCITSHGLCVPGEICHRIRHADVVNFAILVCSKCT